MTETAEVIDVQATEVKALVVPNDALQSFQRLGLGVAQAVEYANQLRQIVDAKRLAVPMGQGEHLRIEAWTSLASMVGVSAATEWTRPERHPTTGELEGYHARARVIRLATGEEIGAAENGCFFDEDVKRRDGSYYKRWIENGKPVRHAALSMSQTRACSKALGQVLRWIPVLAGFSGTPYEEMSEEEARRPDPPPPPRTEPLTGIPEEQEFVFGPDAPEPPPPAKRYARWLDTTITTSKLSEWKETTWKEMAGGSFGGRRYKWLRRVLALPEPPVTTKERALAIVYGIEQREHHRRADLEAAKETEREKF
jgi:hypothetical protein